MSTDLMQDYLHSLPDDRKEPMSKLLETMRQSLPDGFSESLASGMIHFVVPQSLYPNGYHCNPKQALPFISVASQKNFIAIYHMGLYADPELLAWFLAQWPSHAKGKLDMGKSCVRLKKMDDIPYELLGTLCSKMSPSDWISLYEANLRK